VCRSRRLQSTRVAAFSGRRRHLAAGGAGIPLCFVMIGAGVYLGRQQEARSKPDAAPADGKVPASA